MNTQVPLGTETLSVSLPDCAVSVATPPGKDSVDVRDRAMAAMESPHGRPLSERVQPGESVAIVITDVTRATPDDVLLDALLEELDNAGVDRDGITVVVGLGLHRPMSQDEIERALGEHADLAVNHDPNQTVEVGRVSGCPIELFEPVAEAERLLSTGMVEPHQYAGFSGGAKTAVIGAGGESQIRFTHGPALLGQDGVRLGRIDDNPFRAFLDRAGDVAGVAFCLNVTSGPDGILGVSAGDPRAVVAELAERARDAVAFEVQGDVDAVVAGVSASKGANLYQATRAATYVVLGARNPLRADGRVVVPARLQEGAGHGTGEQRFYEWLSTAENPEALYEEMSEGYEPGAQRAYVVAQTLRRHDIWMTNTESPDIVTECLMEAAPGVEDAIEPGSDVLVVPDALNTLLV